MGNALKIKNPAHKLIALEISETAGSGGGFAVDSDSVRTDVGTGDKDGHRVACMLAQFDRDRMVR
jgi:hypothetical protein